MPTLKPTIAFKRPKQQALNQLTILYVALVSVLALLARLYFLSPGKLIGIGHLR